MGRVDVAPFQPVFRLDVIPKLLVLLVLADACYGAAYMTDLPAGNVGAAMRGDSPGPRSWLAAARDRAAPVGPTLAGATGLAGPVHHRRAPRAAVTSTTLPTLTTVFRIPTHAR